MSKIGYIRVSSIGQETARQDQLMKELGVEKVFSEKLSGKTADRPELQNMLRYIREDDVLYVESISRLSILIHRQFLQDREAPAYLQILKLFSPPRDEQRQQGRRT